MKQAMKVTQAPNRICIYPKDVQRITGKTYNQARMYLNRIKDDLKKTPGQFVSVGEFCAYSGLPEGEVLGCLV